MYAPPKSTIVKMTIPIRHQRRRQVAINNLLRQDPHASAPQGTMRPYVQMPAWPRAEQQPARAGDAEQKSCHLAVGLLQHLGQPVAVSLLSPMTQCDLSVQFETVACKDGFGMVSADTKSELSVPSESTPGNCKPCWSPTPRAGRLGRDAQWGPWRRRRTRRCFAWPGWLSAGSILRRRKGNVLCDFGRRNRLREPGDSTAGMGSFPPHRPQRRGFGRRRQDHVVVTRLEDLGDSLRGLLTRSRDFR